MRPPTELLGQMATRGSSNDEIASLLVFAAAVAIKSRRAVPSFDAWLPDIAQRLSPRVEMAWRRSYAHALSVLMTLSAEEIEAAITLNRAYLEEKGYRIEVQGH